MAMQRIVPNLFGFYWMDGYMQLIAVTLATITQCPLKLVIIMISNRPCVGLDGFNLGLGWVGARLRGRFTEH